MAKGLGFGVGAVRRISQRRFKNSLPVSCCCHEASASAKKRRGVFREKYLKRRPSIKKGDY